MSASFILKGVASGYVLKSFQLGSSIIMVPFLLDPAVLGVQGYGVVGAYLSMTALFALFVDGTKLEVARQVGRSIGRGNQSVIVHELRSACEMMALFIGSVAIITSPFWIRALGFQIDATHLRTAIAVCFIFIVELAGWAYQSVLHASGKSHLLNSLLCGEVILRNLAMFLLFRFVVGVDVYFALMLLGSAVRVAWCRSICMKELVRSAAADNSYSHKKVISLFAQSKGASAGAVTTYLVYRTPVLLAIRFLGAESAGYISLVLVTLRGYLVQGLFGVFQPMIVPLGSKISVRELSAVKRRALEFGLRAFGCATLIACCGAALFSHVWVSYWLGHQYLHLVPWVELFLFGSALALGNLPKVMVLVSQGEAGSVAYVTVPGAIITVLATIYVFTFEEISYGFLIALPAIYAALVGGIAIDIVYSKKLRGTHLEDFPGLSRKVLAFGVWIAALAILKSISFQEWGYAFYILVSVFTALASARLVLGHPRHVAASLSSFRR